MHNTCAICWPSETQKWQQTPSNDMEEASKDPALWEFFVPGTDGFLTQDINKKLRLANGTRVRYNSIQPTSDEQKNFIKNKLESSHPGSIIHLESSPFAINVELIDEDTSPANLSLWQEFSICTNKIVIPLLPRKNKNESQPLSWVD